MNQPARTQSRNCSRSVNGASSAKLAILSTALILLGCSPTVKVEAPDKPIEINLNVRIQQEVRIKVERDVETLLQTEDGLF